MARAYEVQSRRQTACRLTRRTMTKPEDARSNCRIEWRLEEMFLRGELTSPC